MQYYTRKFGADRISEMLPYVANVGLEYKLNIRFGGKIGNTLNAHCLVAYAAQKKRDVEAMELLYKAYFDRQLDISNTNVLLAVASDLGLNVKEVRNAILSSDMKVLTVLKDVELSNRLRIGGVPNFIMNQKYQLSGAQDVTTFLSVFEHIGVYDPESDPRRIPVPTAASEKLRNILQLASNVSKFCTERDTKSQTDTEQSSSSNNLVSQINTVDASPANGLSTVPHELIESEPSDA